MAKMIKDIWNKNQIVHASLPVNSEKRTPEKTELHTKCLIRRLCAGLNEISLLLAHVV